MGGISNEKKPLRSAVAAFAPPSGSVSARVQLKNALLFGELQQQDLQPPSTSSARNRVQSALRVTDKKPRKKSAFVSPNAAGSSAAVDKAK